MPVNTSELPEEVQLAIFIFSMLSDIWDGTSGSYMGKNWVDCEFICKVHNIDNVSIVLYFAKLYERLTMNHRAEVASNKRKAEERKAKAGGGTNYTHNVQR
jgi:hypothetical protein